MQKHNLHTHTRYSDGHDTPRQMIEEAVSRGFTALGFSDHSYAWFESYYSMSPEGTRRSFREIRALPEEAPVPRRLLALAAQVTDVNGAFFDARNAFKGCIAGIHEVLRRQGLMGGVWLLGEKEGLSPGQKEEIDRVYRLYPDLNDDAFVSEFLRNNP